MSSFFSKSRPVYDASSIGSSSTSLLISMEKKSQATDTDKEYSAALGTLTSQYGPSGHDPSSNVSLPQSQSQPQNIQKARAKEFGATQNKYRALGHGSMTSMM